MDIRYCDRCRMKVLPKSDGTCPSCRSEIAEALAVAPEPVAASVAQPSPTSTPGHDRGDGQASGKPTATGNAHTPPAGPRKKVLAVVAATAALVAVLVYCLAGAPSGSLPADDNGLDELDRKLLEVAKDYCAKAISLFEQARALRNNPASRLTSGQLEDLVKEAAEQGELCKKVAPLVARVAREKKTIVSKIFVSGHDKAKLASWYDSEKESIECVGSNSGQGKCFDCLAGRWEACRECIGSSSGVLGCTSGLKSKLPIFGH